MACVSPRSCQGSAAHVRWLTPLFTLILLLAGCSSEAQKEEERRRAMGEARSLESDEDPLEPYAPDVAKLIFLVTVDHHLYAFNPTQPGLGAYRRIGKLNCKGGGNPQSMSIDRQGTAWVFFDSRQLYRVSTKDASCESTNYKHPSFHYQLGMGFTSVGPGSQQEDLYIISPEFGLATIGLPNFSVNKTGKLSRPAELTGGGDGKLFLFQSDGAKLSEVDRRSYELSPIHTFKLGHVAAWAFARYGGRFYLFTSPNGYAGSRTTIYDPTRNTETTRDDNVGFVVVGAGQSTLVPPSDQGAGIAGDFAPPEPSAP